MANTLSIGIFVFLGAFGLGALCLWIVGLCYTARTGKPGAERSRERIEALNRPISRARYVGFSFFFGVMFLFWAAALVWSHNYRGRAAIIAISWLIFSLAYFFHFQVRWRKQRRSERPDAASSQLSGPAK